ncbi:MAG: MerR family transcriptional regulator [Candidatus Aminicenantes bacterium]|nr:MerR family transcriptional regulator [Candidatus Aminicenantes bacterium]
MKKAMFPREEPLERVGISEDELKRWEQKKLIHPVGKTADKIDFYTKAAGDRIEHIKKLLDLGYQPEHILKIIKKVGLPQGQEKKGRPEKIHEFLTVGGLAERVGISPRAIKHWEDKGIIEPDMRSEGGFRLYSETYIHYCQLIKDLQLFGYSLEEIKIISDLFRDFLAINSDISSFSFDETSRKLVTMTGKIKEFENKVKLFKDGMERWERLLKKKKKEISGLKTQNEKLPNLPGKKSDA